ncbi:MAG: ester cyclase [Desulfobacteraceae bacterium]|nr:MAG: ester cyclase [Desulfobacteraceae bacterium]
MSLEENKITVCRFYDEVFNKGNLDVVDDIFSPDYVIGGLPPGKSPSREGLKQTALMYRNAFPDLHVTIHDTIAEEGKIAVRLVVTGTHKGLFYSIEPTNKQVEIKGITIYRFKDGKIVEGWAIRDELGTFQQLGVIPKQW